MNTKKTLFDKTIFKNNLGKFWVVSAVYAFALYLCMVLSIMSDVLATPGAPDGQFEFEILECIQNNIQLNVYFAFIVSGLMSILTFSYLQKAKSVSFFHSLPISREGLLITNIVSSLVIMYIPNILIALIMFIQVKAMGCTAFSEILVWLIVICVEELFYYLLGSFCMLLCGNEIVSGITYIFLIYAPYYVFMFIISIFRCISYGFEFMSDISVYLNKISPQFLFDGILMKIERESVNGQIKVGYEFVGLTSTLLYVLAVSAVIMILCFIIYKCRRSEGAEDLIAVRWFKTVAEFGLSISISFLIISQTITSVGGVSIPLDSKELKILFVADFLITGFVVYIVIRLIFDRKKIKFKKLLFSCAANLVVLSAIAVSMLFVSDKLEKYFPEEDDIEFVNFQCFLMNGEEYDLSRRYIFNVSDRELINKILELNKKASECKDNWLKYNTAKGYVKVIFNYQLKEKAVVSGAVEQNFSFVRFYEISEADSFYEICRDMMQPDMLDFLTDKTEIDQIMVCSEDYSTVYTVSDTSDINDIMNALSEDARADRLSFAMAGFEFPGIAEETGRTIYRLQYFSNRSVTENADENTDENAAIEERYINFTENCTSLMQVLNRLSQK